MVMFCLFLAFAEEMNDIFVLLQGQQAPPYIPANANIGQSLGNFRKNYRQVGAVSFELSTRRALICCLEGFMSSLVFMCPQTVCTYWLKGLCMKGEECGFLHQLDPQRMPVCRTLLKFGECKDPECQFKHDLHEVKVSSAILVTTAAACIGDWVPRPARVRYPASMRLTLVLCETRRSATCTSWASVYMGPGVDSGTHGCLGRRRPRRPSRRPSRVTSVI